MSVLMYLCELPCWKYNAYVLFIEVSINSCISKFIRCISCSIFRAHCWSFYVMWWSHPRGKGRVLWSVTSPEIWEGQRSMRRRSESSIKPFEFYFQRCLVWAVTVWIFQYYQFSKIPLFLSYFKDIWKVCCEHECCLNKSSEQHRSRICNWLDLSFCGVAGWGSQRRDFAEVFGWHDVHTSADSAQIRHPVWQW